MVRNVIKGRNDDSCDVFDNLPNGSRLDNKVEGVDDIYKYFHSQREKIRQYDEEKKKGQVRAENGKTVVTLAKMCVSLARDQLKIDKSAIRFIEEEKVNGELVDVAVDMNGHPLFKIECKSYTEMNMFKRTISRFANVYKEFSNSHYILFQLENALGGDYDENNLHNEMIGCSKVNECLEEVNFDIHIFTLMNGKRNSLKCFYDDKYLKTIDHDKLVRTINEFKKLLETGCKKIKFSSKLLILFYNIYKKVKGSINYA